MIRIDTLTKVLDLFGLGKHGFRDGNRALSVPATDFSARWCNSLQEEICNVIEGAGIPLDANDLTQLRQAIQQMIVGAQKAVIINNATFEASVANGEPVRWDAGNNRFDEAVADGTANNRAVGIADVTNSKVYLYGECPLFSGLTPGARYYLDQTTPGAITTVAPANGVSVGIAKSATILFVDIDVASAVTTGNDPTFVDNSDKPASTGWIRSAMGAIATAAGFSYSLTSNGYIKFPRWLSGVIIQWMGGVATNSGTTFNYPIAFPNSVLCAFVSTNNAPSPQFAYLGLYYASSAVVYSQSAAGANTGLFVIGK